jgi:hypothetical protein
VPHLARTRRQPSTPTLGPRPDVTDAASDGHWLLASLHDGREKIGAALNVSQRTISEDLRNLEVASKSKPAKTASNPPVVVARGRKEKGGSMAALSSCCFGDSVYAG